MAGRAMKLFQHRQAQWHWKSRPNTSSINEEEEWTRYSDIESEIIEEEFNKNPNAALVELDDCWIDLKNYISISKRDNNTQLQIKRIPINNNETLHLRKERFFAPLESDKPFNEWTSG
ncbi:unnamed protein product, partial [Didymodactylos carnosus]